MTYLLDTNFLSELRRGSRQACEWVEPVDASELYVSVVTLGEIAKGAAAKAKTDPRTARTLIGWLAELRKDYADGVVPVDDEIALEWGRLEAQRPRGADGMLAATAIVRGYTIVTRNVADFRDVPVRVANPWVAP